MTWPTLAKDGPGRRLGKAKAKRPRSSYARRPRFIDYMLWVKAQPCVLSYPRSPGFDPVPSHDHCDGVIEADHAGARAIGRKCHDFEVIPLCKRHHDMRPGRRGPFSLLTREEMRAWILEKVASIQRYAIFCQAPDHKHLRAWLNKDKEAA